jgi:hypothetical protein
VGGRPFTILVEPTRADCIHACSVEDLFRVLGALPGPDLEGLGLLVLRQPKRKEQILSSVWGRLSYSLEIGRHQGPAVILEAIPLAQPMIWSRSLDPVGMAEQERLRQDGHTIRATRRGYLIETTAESVRATQLYRTLLHEIGHWNDYLRSVIRPAGATPYSFAALSDRYRSRPCSEREAFAHRYAERMGGLLRTWGVIPFPRLSDEG